MNNSIWIAAKTIIHRLDYLSKFTANLGVLKKSTKENHKKNYTKNTQKETKSKRFRTHRILFFELIVFF